MLSSERPAPHPRSPVQCRHRHGGTGRGRRRPCPTRRCRLPLCIDGRLEAEEATNQVGRGRGDPRAAEQGRSEQAAPAAAASTDRSIPPRTDPNASAPLYLLVYTCAHHTDAPAPAPAPASSTLDELASRHHRPGKAIERRGQEEAGGTQTTAASQPEISDSSVRRRHHHSSSAPSHTYVLPSSLLCFTLLRFPSLSPPHHHDEPMILSARRLDTTASRPITRSLAHYPPTPASLSRRISAGAGATVPARSVPSGVIRKASKSTLPRGRRQRRPPGRGSSPSSSSLV